MTTRHDNTINFMYFMSNYRQGFIFDVWKDDSRLATHLNNKFTVFCYESESSASAFVKWFYDLDRDNQCKLLEWVNENYKSFSNLTL